MASPQKENGFTPIANEIMEALSRVNLSPYESRVFWFVVRRTYGFNKKTDRISLSQFETGTGIKDRHVVRAIKSLVKKQMLLTHKDSPQSVTYGVQKDYERWFKPLPLQGVLVEGVPLQGVPGEGETSTSTGSGTSTSTGRYKRQKTIQKTKGVSSSTISKKRKLTRPDPAVLEAFGRFYEAYPRHVAKQKALEAWQKLNPAPDLISVMMAAVQRYGEEAEGTERRFVLHLATWLNQRRWEDEINVGGNDKRPEVRDIGDGWVEFNGHKMKRADYERRFAKSS
jgi:phage replication O-like protein O